jgi:hypothetical protein
MAGISAVYGCWRAFTAQLAARPHDAPESNKAEAALRFRNGSP